MRSVETKKMSHTNLKQGAIKIKIKLYCCRKECDFMYRLTYFNTDQLWPQVGSEERFACLYKQVITVSSKQIVTQGLFK